MLMMMLVDEENKMLNPVCPATHKAEAKRRNLKKSLKQNNITNSCSLVIELQTPKSFKSHNEHANDFEKHRNEFQD